MPWSNFFPPRTGRIWKISRYTLTGLIIVAVLLLIVRTTLPFFVLRYVNGVLSELPDYRGSVAEVDLHLWRGAYQIHDLKLEKRTEKKTFAPFLDAPVVDFSVEWRALFEGAVVGEVVFDRPQLNFVDAPTKEQSQLGIDRSWGEKFEKLFPLQINRLQINRGTLSFRNPTSTPPVDLRLTHLEVLGTNLTNSRETKEELAAHVKIDAQALKTGRLHSQLRLNPISRKPDFFLSGELKKVVMTEMNDFLKAYANVDAEAGHFQAYAEIRVRQGRIEGYLKPIIEDLELVNLDDFGKNPLRVVWESLVSSVVFFFTNHSRDTVATRIPLSGTVDGPSPDWLALIGGLLRNAYIQQIAPGLDQQGLKIQNPRAREEEKKKAASD